MYQHENFHSSLIKATFHLTISMRGQRATDKVERNNITGVAGKIQRMVTSQELWTFFNGYNVVSVFDLQPRDALECQKSVSEK